jgi:hypothetical protein
VRLDLKDLRNAPGGAAAVKVWQRSAGAWGHEIVAEAYALDDGRATYLFFSILQPHPHRTGS